MPEHQAARGLVHPHEPVLLGGIEIPQVRFAVHFPRGRGQHTEVTGAVQGGEQEKGAGRGGQGPDAGAAC
ncbi:hypothetical protein [Streptomyces sp. NPDC007088]|uniref:hypothetical protein n=1 Tax=Streptomyces sp. NPDC007088 TaxID=3364773 RepID=UPI0036CEFFCF